MQKELSIESIRTDYRLAELHEDQVAKDPIQQFKHWFTQALQAQVTEVNAMTLATVDHEGNPAARIVLLKDIEDDGFVFYTNYLSHKGKEIAHHPVVSLVFFWPDLQRQVRVNGIADKVKDQVSEKYFHSRPIGSQQGAWASPQSAVIANRTVLEEELSTIAERYKDQVIPKPPHWGGYIVRPTVLEFWQGRANRLHDRLLYTKTGSTWKIERLAP
ncbi:pyridoxamine 5'-phosphate oxidase [Olivibacter ginsenosidimutans]|uniref:Pyridoxine/pyridoxamine 5'-phosphate oxidase n=1 Tax=Olivibacter ginsenosidimutans TaxID=1176537 RepID=A0ABP9ACY9_9SPHI